MLSREQLWRRLKCRRAKERLRHQAEYETFLVRAAAERKHTEKPQSARSPRVVVPPTDYSELKIKSIPGRKVRFSPVIRVCLVHCRADLLDDFDKLFWVREDYQTFKEDALRELRAHWLKNRTTVKEAINDLYQPSPEEFAQPKTIFSHVDSVPQLRLSVDVEAGLYGDIESGGMKGMPSPTGSTSSTESVEEYSEEVKQQGAEARSTVHHLTVHTPNSAADSDSRSFQSEEKQHGGLLCNIANGGMDLITPLKGDTSRHGHRHHVHTNTEIDAPPAPPAPHHNHLHNHHQEPEVRHGILKHTSPNKVGSSRKTMETTPSTGLVFSTPTPALSQPSPSTSRDIKSLSGEGVRMILVEESPASSVSSFEPPMLTC